MNVAIILDLSANIFKLTDIQARLFIITISVLYQMRPYNEYNKVKALTSNKFTLSADSKFVVQVQDLPNIKAP